MKELETVLDKIASLRHLSDFLLRLQGKETD